MLSVTKSPLTRAKRTMRRSRLKQSPQKLKIQKTSLPKSLKRMKQSLLLRHRSPTGPSRQQHLLLTGRSPLPRLQAHSHLPRQPRTAQRKHPRLPSSLFLLSSRRSLQFLHRQKTTSLLMIPTMLISLQRILRTSLMSPRYSHIFPKSLKPS